MSKDGAVSMHDMQAAGESAGPPVPVQAFVGILGVFAVPVVGWSLYTLANTGQLPVPHPAPHSRAPVAGHMCTGL
jgi:hypothetical protein